MGWEPSLQFEEGLGKTVDWYLANQGWLERVTFPATQETNEVPVHNFDDVFWGITSFFQQAGDLLQIGNGVHVARCLLGAEASVEIAADAAVVGVPRELADVIDVIDKVGETKAGVLGGRLASYPVWDHHPAIERATNDGVSLNKYF